MTISKALQRFIASGGKIQKLKPKKFKRQYSSGTDRSSKIADQNIRDTLGPDPLEFGTAKHQSARILRQESIGRRWAERKFVRSLPQEIKKGRTVIARKLKSFDPIKKSAYKPIKSPTSTDIKFHNYPKKFTASIALKKAKSTSALKRYKKVVSETDVLASRISERTSPFKHILTETKFIKSKRFKKGKFDQPYPKTFSKLETAAYYEGKRRKEYFGKRNITKATSKDWKGFWKSEKARKKEYRDFYKKKK